MIVFAVNAKKKIGDNQVDSKIKHRIIGIIAIVALAVIFLPMLFTHSFNDTTLKLSSHVPSAPSKPDIELNASTPTPGPIETSSNAAASVSTTNNDNNSLATAPLHMTSDNSKVESTTDTPSNDGNLSDALTSSVTSSPSSIAVKPSTEIAAEKTTSNNKTFVTTKTSVVAPKMMDLKQPVIKNAPAASSAAAWTIQVGSFSNKNNAQQLMKKLRSKGFAAYTNEIKAGAVAMTRVFVGPELQRDKAENILTQLQQKIGLKGVIVPYQV